MRSIQGLYQRGKVWWLRFTPAPGEAQIRVALKTTDEIEAQKRAREIRDQHAGQAREERGSCEKEVQAYLADCKRRGLTRTTVSARSYLLTSFIAAVPAHTPRQITPQQVQRWFAAEWKIKKASTVTAYLILLRCWFSWLQETGKIVANPTDKIEVPKTTRKGRQVFLTADQARSLLTACKDPDMKYALYCALHAGMRKNEIIESKREWFDLEAGLIHIQGTSTLRLKDNDNRTVPLTEEFKFWLRDEFKLRAPFMFRAQETHGKSLYRSNFYQGFKGLAKRAGLPHITIHDLRRTFASLLVSRGVSLYKVAKWLGDTLAIVESTYGHLIAQDDDINKAWEKREVKTPSAPGPSPG